MRLKNTRPDTAGGAELVLGIDIGTSFARATLLHRDGRLMQVRDGYGDEQFPAVVRYGMGGSSSGYYPDRFLITDQENSLRELPRFMGRYADLPRRVLDSATARVYESGGRACFDVLYREATAEDAYAALLTNLAQLAAAQAGAPVRQIALTVPANAEDRMRVAVRDAAAAAGLELLRIVNQPTAALAALRRLMPGKLEGGKVAIVDFGGGTTDVSIAALEPNAIRILATAGDPYLGGVELRRQVAEGLNERFRRSSGADLLARQTGHSRAGELALLRAADEALATLTRQPSAEINLDHGAGFGRDLWTTLAAADAELLIEPSLQRLVELCARALRLAGSDSRELAAVVVCGGGALHGAIRRSVAAAFGVAESALLVRDPLNLAARGAAILAGSELGWSAESVSDVTPYGLGIAAYNAPYPAGRIVFCPIIRPGTPIPTPKGGRAGAPTELFYTREPYQTSLELRVLQYRGSRIIAPFGLPANGGDPEIIPGECEELGCWTLTNIKSRQQSEVEVTFTIDGDGILHLEAHERGTRNVLRQSISRW